AARAAGSRGYRVRRRVQPCYRPRPLRTLPCRHQAGAADAGPRAVQGHDRATAPRAGDGDRRPPAGARRADLGPGHPLPQAVLPAPAGRLLRRGQDHPHHHPPGRGSRAHPDRRDVHPRRPDRAGQRHGGGRRAVHGSAGQRRPGRSRPRHAAHRRACAAVRQDRDDVRRHPARRARPPGRGAHAGAGRPVRRHHEGDLRMNALETTHATAPATHPAGSARLARTFRLLLRREYWEHKGGFLWAPLIAGGISLLLSIMAAIVGLVLLNRAVADGDFQINGIDIGMLTREMSPSDAAQLAQGLDWSLMMSAAWPLIVLAFVVFFYCLGALYDDRKDRSVLFWKSLPLSDTQTVLSKLASAVVVAPVIAVLAAMATMFASLVLMSLLVLAFGGNPVTLLWGPA